MKAEKTDDNFRLVTEPGDTTMEVELKQNLNQLLDALKWFYQRGLKVKVKRAPRGYTIQISK